MYKNPLNTLTLRNEYLKMSDGLLNQFDMVLREIGIMYDNIKPLLSDAERRHSLRVLKECDAVRLNIDRLPYLISLLTAEEAKALCFQDVDYIPNQSVKELYESLGLSYDIAEDVKISASFGYNATGNDPLSPMGNSKVTARFIYEDFIDKFKSTYGKPLCLNSKGHEFPIDKLNASAMAWKIEIHCPWEHNVLSIGYGDNEISAFIFAVKQLINVIRKRQVIY